MCNVPALFLCKMINLFREQRESFFNMGQYLSVYLVGEVTIKLKEGTEVTSQNVNQALRAKGFRLDLDLYNIYSTSSGAYIELKSEVMEEHLVAFMKAFNTYYYGTVGERVQKLLDYIGQLEVIKWEELAEYIEQHCYMEDCCVLSYYKPWSGIVARGIVLMCSDKIETEGCGNICTLLKDLLRDHFAAYAFSKILTVNILE